MRAPCIIKRTTDRHDGLTVDAEYIVRTQLRNGARPSQSFTVVTLKEDKRK